MDAKSQNRDIRSLHFGRFPDIAEQTAYMHSADIVFLPGSKIQPGIGNLDALSGCFSCNSTGQ